MANGRTATAYKHIELTEDDQAILADSQIKVKQLAAEHTVWGYRPEALLSAHYPLTLAQRSSLPTITTIKKNWTQRSRMIKNAPSACVRNRNSSLLLPWRSSERSKLPSLLGRQDSECCVLLLRRMRQLLGLHRVALHF